MAFYVCVEVEYHVSKGWDVDQGTLDWLLDMPQDVITMAAARVVGSSTLERLANENEEAMNWWLAARYWALKQHVDAQGFRVDELVAGSCVKSIDAVIKFQATPNVNKKLMEESDDLLLAQLNQLARTMTPDALTARWAHFERVLKSQAAARDPVVAGLIKGLATMETIADS